MANVRGKTVAMYRYLPCKIPKGLGLSTGLTRNFSPAKDVNAWLKKPSQMKGLANCKILFAGYRE